MMYHCFAISSQIHGRRNFQPVLPILPNLPDRQEDWLTKSLTENLLHRPLNTLNEVAQHNVRAEKEEGEKEYDDDRNDRRVDNLSTRRPGDLLHLQHDLVPELADVRKPTERL